MTLRLGETIYRLRTQNNMSQGDLADALEVSRQSISKWENNSAVPELDKLVRLSQIFGVSLDELVLEKKADPAPWQEPVVQTVYIERKAERSGAKTAGTVLLCFSALVWLLITVMGDIAVGLVLALPFLVCGLICLFVPFRPGLWCFWAVYALVDVYFRYASGVSWKFILNPRFYDRGWTVHLIVAWCMLLPLVVLMIITVVTFSKKPLPSSKKRLIWLLAGWVLVFLPIWTVPSTVPIRVAQILMGLIYWIRNGLFVWVLTVSLRLWKGRKKPE